LALSPLKERNLLKDTLKDTKDRIILLLGCYAGLRSEEIGQCRYDWLEWENYQDIKVLTITIPKECKNSRIPYKKFKQKKEWNTSIYIFDNEVANEIYFYYLNNKEGLKMSRQNITRNRVSAHMGKIIGRHLTTHALRSTYANYIINELRLPNGEKLDPMFVKTQLRHKNLKTTMQHYKTENREQQQSYLKGVMNKDA